MKHILLISALILLAPPFFVRAIDEESVTNEYLPQFYQRRQQERQSRAKRIRLFPDQKKSATAEERRIFLYQKKREQIRSQLQRSTETPLNTYYYARRSARLKARERKEDRYSGGGRVSNFKNQIRRRYLQQK
ncbi:hypothetical protein K9M59_03900 [Candidatus Gracilibacteria bacterium]|nr:hypothetical protein [Candidatus Gracilibacteria bacterium]MCF7819467.1 hypothetical protein [Candidatus Gracilibacteria bacterium]